LELSNCFDVKDEADQKNYLFFKCILRQTNQPNQTKYHWFNFVRLHFWKT